MIRPRRESDLDTLIKVMRQVHEQDAYASVWPAEPLAFIDPPQTLAGFVAEMGGEVVGQVLLREVSEPLPEWVAGFFPSTIIHHPSPLSRLAHSEWPCSS